MTNFINLGSRNLMRGMEGTDVELLQHLLNNLPEPMGSRIAIDGIFGPITENAVKKFQRYFKLSADGIVGPNTFLFLGILIRPYLPAGGQVFGSRTLSKGSRGYDVSVLQNRLATTAKEFADALGKPASGYFDENTERAVMKFQRDVGLVDDGIVGPRTIYKIYEYAGMGGRNLRRGRWDRNQGYDVYWLQRHLKEMGYYTGKLDGIFGSLTEQAVRALQKAANIRVDGIVGPETFYHLAVS
ncbi:MAG: peptidoglycan-binding domain-containing protein [Syntrophomonadales bacterium]|jgi:peptidoglycan hydrolase-like protein with peptidoglycan-binding domain